MKYWVHSDFLCKERSPDSRPLSIFCRSDLPIATSYLIETNPSSVGGNSDSRLQILKILQIL